MNILLINLFFIFSWMMNPVYHPVHVSVCNMELNADSGIVAVKLFKDDFALVLKNKTQKDVQMEKADEKLNSQLISKYINSCLQIEINKNEILKLNYNYSELNEDAIWIYFQIEKTQDASHLRIRNSLMLDLWEDQTNLMIINWEGKENGYRFNSKELEIEIDRNN